MERRQIGAVKELFRYPVKSMLGERLTRFWMTTRPRSSTPWSWNTFFATSIPSVVHFIAHPPSHLVMGNPFWPILRPFREGERSIPLKPVASDTFLIACLRKPNFPLPLALEVM